MDEKDTMAYRPTTRSDAPQSGASIGRPKAGGGNPNIMPPHSSHEEENASVTGGVDWLAVCLYGSWSAESWSKITAILDAAKEKAAEANSKEGEVTQSPAGADLLVFPYSVRHGVICRWAFTWRGCQFAFVNRQIASENGPNIFLTIPSRVLLATDWWSAWLEVLEFLALHGFRYDDSVVSRVDVCVDLPGQSVQPFIDAYRESRFITRARKRAMYGESPTSDHGLQLGAGDILMRIYDKAIESKHDEEKTKLLIGGRWNGELCDTAARVEFQVRRQLIKQQGVRGVEDLRKSLPFIIGYCCELWCRMTLAPVDRENGNHSRAEAAPLWQMVCDKFYAWSGYTEAGRRERRKVQLGARPLVRQAGGCLSSALAVSGKQVNTIEEARAAVLELINPDLAAMVKKTNEKRRRWQATSGAPLVSPSDIPY